MAQQPRRSKEAVLECLTALIALGVLLYFFSPGFRSFINTFVLVLTILVLVAILIFAIAWVYFTVTKEEPPPAFEATYHESGHGKKPGEAKPMAKEKTEDDQPVSEPAIYRIKLSP
jgi:hypothetical protein